MNLSKIRVWFRSVFKSNEQLMDEAIEDLKQNYADAVYNLDYDVRRGEDGEIILIPILTRIK